MWSVLSNEIAHAWFYRAGVSAFAFLFGFLNHQCSPVAQNAYPVRMVRIVVPFPAGGTADALPRIVGEKLGQKWNQPVVIENRAGAGGNIGSDVVANARADGYVLLASPPGPIAINEHLYKSLSFRSSSFRLITLLGAVPNVLVVRPSLPARTVPELIELAKANPGKITFASQGNGSTSHLSAVLFQKLTGVQLVHVPYRGTAPALQDLMGDHVDLFFDNLASSLSLHAAGTVRILAVGSADRVSTLPDMPTIAEKGPDGFESVTWFVLAAPSGLSDEIALRLHGDVSEVLRQSEVREQLMRLGVQPGGGTPAATEEFVASERARWRGVIESARIKLE